MQDSVFENALKISYFICLVVSSLSYLCSCNRDAYDFQESFTDRNDSSTRLGVFGIIFYLGT